MLYLDIPDLVHKLFQYQQATVTSDATTIFANISSYHKTNVSNKPTETDYGLLGPFFLFESMCQETKNWL